MTDAKDEELTIDGATYTKSQVHDMDDGEFEHAVVYAGQLGTSEALQAVETLNKWRGKKVKATDEE